MDGDACADCGRVVGPGRVTDRAGPSRRGAVGTLPKPPSPTATSKPDRWRRSFTATVIADGRGRVLVGPQRDDLPDDLRAALDDDPGAAAFWDSLAQFCRNAYRWINVTKRHPDQRGLRITEVVGLLHDGHKQRSTDCRVVDPTVKGIFGPPTGMLAQWSLGTLSFGLWASGQRGRTYTPFGQASEPAGVHY